MSDEKLTPGPKVPAGMPELTEWWEVTEDLGMWIVTDGRPNNPRSYGWGNALSFGLTALRFETPDGLEVVEWTRLVPVQWFAATSIGPESPWTPESNPRHGDIPLSATHALMVPPRSYGGHKTMPASNPESVTVCYEVTVCEDCQYAAQSGYRAERCCAKSVRGRMIPFDCWVIPAWCPYRKENQNA